MGPRNQLLPHAPNVTEAPFQQPSRIRKLTSPLPSTSVTHAMAPPTSFMMSGIFTLSFGLKTTETPGYHVYTTAVNFIDPRVSVRVSVRLYAPDQALHGNGTLAYIVARAAFPTTGAGRLDAMHYVLLGTSSPEVMPSQSTHAAFVAGTVTRVGTAEPGGGGPLGQSFSLAVSEWARGERHYFDVRRVSTTSRSRRDSADAVGFQLRFRQDLDAMAAHAGAAGRIPCHHIREVQSPGGREDGVGNHRGDL